MKKILRNKGFTLIEMLVAMSIFVIFIGVLISSYTDIVKSQQEANDYRVLYSDARRVFDKLTEEIRGSAVYYPSESSTYYTNVNESLRLVSLDGQREVVFEYYGEEGELWYGEAVGAVGNEYSLIGSEDSRVSVSEFNVFVSPVDDPYKEENVFADGVQFQPKVTVFATFEMERRKGGDPYSVDLQTTISSRFYTESPKLEIPYLFTFTNE